MHIVVGLPAACTSIEPLIRACGQKMLFFLGWNVWIFVDCLSLFLVAVIVVFVLLGGGEYILCLYLSMIIYN